MNKLNCSVGDIAITVNCKLEANMGTIVKIISACGYELWPRHDQPLYTWNVEVATEDGFLYYQRNGELESHKSGPVPDIYLRRLTPPKGYLMEEFADSEQLQIDLHLDDYMEIGADV